MALVTELELPAFDPTDVSMRGERFHRAMSEVRTKGAPNDGGQAPHGGGQAGGQSWLAQGPYGYIALDRESAEFFLRTRSAIFPGMKIAEIFEVTEGPLYEQMKRNILHVNGPDHTRLRSLVNPALSARAVERYRPNMQTFLEQLLQDALAASPAAQQVAGGDGAGADGAGAASGAGEELVHCEFVDAFAKPYPSMVIADVMGAPLEDAPKLHHWSNWIQRQFDAGSMASEREKIEQAVEEFYEYAESLLRTRRRSPGDDLISKLIAAEEEGDKLSDVECINLVFNVLVGGVDTSQSQLAHAIRLLAENPGQWEQLQRDPGLAEAAVEEALRYEPITPFTARILVEEVTYRDVTFPEGTVVMVCAFTGNRDLGDDSSSAGAVDRFDILAASNRPTGSRGRALTFGAGVHYCLGANLARLELAEGLTFLATRLGTLELDGEPQYGTISGIYGLDALPIRFSIRSGRP
jgi:cytochrome P450